METIRVLLADDHALLRAGIRALLTGMRNIEVVAEAGTGREAFALVESHRPNVVLMDITMPDMNGLEATGRIVKEHARVQVIILSMHKSEEYVARALRAGAAGYLLKDAAPAELEHAIRKVANGETYLTPAVPHQRVEEYMRRVGGESGPLELLTPRQREVLQLVAEGRSTKQIAMALQVTVKTVETHRALLMERLGIYEVAGLVRLAISTGLVGGEQPPLSSSVSS